MTSDGKSDLKTRLSNLILLIQRLILKLWLKQLIEVICLKRLWVMHTFHSLWRKMEISHLTTPKNRNSYFMKDLIKYLYTTREFLQEQILTCKKWQHFQRSVVPQYACEVSSLRKMKMAKTWIWKTTNLNQNTSYYRRRFYAYPIVTQKVFTTTIGPILIEVNKTCTNLSTNDPIHSWISQ